MTRPAGRGAQFAEQLREQGHEVLHVPLTRIEDADAFPDPSGFDGVLFTSAEAVRRAPACDAWPRVGAVGPATAEALQKRGIRVDVVGEGGGFELAEAWGPCEGQRLLLPQAEQAHAALEVELRDGGADVTCVAVYRTVPAETPDVATLRSADLICFFAPSAVAAFDALAIETGATYWGVGSTTRAAMRHLQPQIELELG